MADLLVGNGEISSQSGATASTAPGRLARLAARLLRCPIALVSLREGDRHWIEGAVGLPAIGFDREACIPPSLLHGTGPDPRPTSVADLRADPDLARHPALDALGAVAYLGFPLRGDGGETLGTLSLIDTAPREWTGDDLAALADLAATASPGLTPSRAASADLARFVEFTPIILFLFDLEAFRPSYVSGDVIADLGYTPGQLTTMGIDDLKGLVHPDDLGRLFAYFEAMRDLKDDERTTIEFRLRCAEGSWRWLHTRSMIYRRDPSGRPLLSINAGTNLTSEKEHEEALMAEKERYRLATEAAFGICYDVDMARNRVLAPVERVSELLGAPAGEIESAHSWWLGRIHPDDMARLASEMLNLEGAPEVRFDFEYRIRHEAGHYLWVWDRGFQFADPDGTPVRRVGCLIDLTDQRQTELDLRRNGERLKLLSDAASLLLRNDRPSEFMPGLFRELSDLLGLEIYLNYIVTDDGKRLRLDSQHGITDEMARAAQSLEFGESISGTVARDRAPWIIEGTLPETDPNAVLFHKLGLTAYACFPLMAGDRIHGTLGLGSGRRDRFAPGEVELLQAVCDQIGLAMGRLDLIGQSRKQAELLRENDRRKDEFLAMLAHELRNPLASIRGANQLLSLPDLPEADLEWSRAVIDRQVGHLVQMIDDLLDISRITRGKIKLRKAPTDLAEIIERAVESTRSLIDSKHHDFEVRVDPGPLMVLGDPIRLEQILVNLLSNAVKYTDPGGKIELSSAVDAESIVVRVRDNGIGIAPDLIPSVFELFTQIPRTLDRSQGGLGIGLSLVERMAEMHDGRIVAFSEGLGHGSEFTLTLPRLYPSESSKAQEVAPGLGGPPPPAPGRPLRVLVVDDNRDTAHSLSKLLVSAGHETKVAYDGRSAVDLAVSYLPDVAILDIGLPGMNGYEVADAIRQRRQLSKTLLISASGYGQPHVFEDSRAAGFQHHLIKPINFDILLSLISTPAPTKAP